MQVQLKAKMLPQDYRHFNNGGADDCALAMGENMLQMPNDKLAGLAHKLDF